jgi:membrane-associated phospholipid phosphatase
MRPAGPRLAVFDVDGTLVDSRRSIAEAMDQAFAAVGFTVLSPRFPCVAALRMEPAQVHRFGAAIDAAATDPALGAGGAVGLLSVSFSGGLALAAAGARPGRVRAALVIGPGLVVNGLFKSLWGRPRPVAVDIFGGDAPYQTVWQISDWCQSNCSFVSGEASSAAWLVAATVLIPARLRSVLVPPVVLYALLLSLNRLAFGGHFLSDIVLSWAISGLVFTVLYRVMVSAPGVATRARVRALKGVVPASARTTPRLPL